MIAHSVCPQSDRVAWRKGFNGSAARTSGPHQRAYSARLQEFGESVFQPERIHRQVDELAGVLRPALGEESAEKLAQMNKAAAGEKVAMSMGPGFTGDILTKPIKPFVEARSRAVEDQLAGKSEGQSINPGFGGSR